jgi:hypothetical protein
VVCESSQSSAILPEAVVAARRLMRASGGYLEVFPQRLEG